MNYDAEIEAATAEQELNGTAWPHLNPNYEGKPLGEALPLEMGSHRSIPRSEMSPGWLVQESLNRGGPVAGRLLKKERADDGWLAWCYLGDLPRVSNYAYVNEHTVGDSAYKPYFVTDDEVAEGKGGTLIEGAEEAA